MRNNFIGEKYLRVRKNLTGEKVKVCTLMRMNIQDIYQERELVLVVIKVGLLLLGIKLGLVFVEV